MTTVLLIPIKSNTIAKVAFFGCGDSQCYGDYWCDAMGELHDCFTGTGASVIGTSWSYRK